MNVKDIKTSSLQEKFEYADLVYSTTKPDYVHRPAKSIREFIDSDFYLASRSECFPAIKDILDGFYKSKKHIGVFIVPPGAGKSYFSSVVASYETHKLLCFKNPQEKMGLARGSNIAVMNMSQNGQQAKKVVFGEINARISYSPWYNKFAMPDENIKSELKFVNNICIIPGNSAQTNPFGYNLVVVIIDEAAWWEHTKDKDYVKDTFETLEKRLQNRYGDKYDWKIILISNPSYPTEYIESLIDDPRVFGIRRAIWDIKPWLFSKNMVPWERYKIPAELREEATKNPDIFKRDRLGIPSETISPWLVNKDTINGCLKKDFKNIASAGLVVNWGALPNLKAKQCFIHVDMGLTGDAAGLCLGYKEMGKVKVPLILRVQGTQQNPVKFSDIRQVIISIRDAGVNIKRVSYDGWQSIDSKQILQNYGFDCEILSIDRDKQPYATLREMIYDGKLELPWVDVEKCRVNPVAPEEWLVRELIGLEEYTQKVDHKPGGSKDLADALAGCVYWTVREGYDSKGQASGQVFEVSTFGKCEAAEDSY